MLNIARKAIGNYIPKEIYENNVLILIYLLSHLNVVQTKIEKFNTINLRMISLGFIQN